MNIHDMLLYLECNDLKGTMAETTDVTKIKKMIDFWKLDKGEAKQLEFHTEKGFI